MDMEEKKLTADAAEQALPVQELPADIPAEVRQNAALRRDFCRKAERFKRLLDPHGRLLRIAGRAVDGQKLTCLCRRKLRVLSFHSASLLSKFLFS